MNSENYSRREFLRTFAMMSSAPLLASILSGCGSSTTTNENKVMYGPSPVQPVLVVVMSFLDAQSSPVELSGSRNVPVHTSFIIQFNTAMDMNSVAAAISFVDSGSSPVVFTASPQSDWSIQVTPSSDLASNSDYTLSVNNNAMSSGGSGLTVDAKSTATFKTGA